MTATAVDVQGSSKWTKKNFYSLPERGVRDSDEVQQQENHASFKITLSLEDQVLRNVGVLEVRITHLIWLCTPCGPAEQKN